MSEKEIKDDSEGFGLEGTRRVELPFTRLDEIQILPMEDGCGADQEFHLECAKFEMSFQHPKESQLCEPRILVQAGVFILN